jgi:ComF family protein
MRPYREAFWRLLYPASCGFCRASLTLEESGLCRACQDRLAEVRFQPEEAAVDVPPPFVDEAWCVFPYVSPVREAVTAAKFAGRPWLLEIFAGSLKPLALAIAGDRGFDAIVPVPLPAFRYLKRRFNQSEILARLIGRASGLPVAGRVLAKRWHAAPQSKLDRNARQKNVRGAFYLGIGQRVKSQRLLVVDDILTTGATSSEAARTLKAQGAAKVGVLALAKAEAP